MHGREVSLLEIRTIEHIHFSINIQFNNNINWSSVARRRNYFYYSSGILAYAYNKKKIDSISVN